MKRPCASDLRKIFDRAVNSVLPATLFSPEVLTQTINSAGEQVLQVCGEAVIATGKKCHLVGFGKAVLGMAVQAERILAGSLSSGIVSIPTGTMDKFRNVPGMTFVGGSVVKVYEGAKDNLPDPAAMRAAVDIKNLAESMSLDDILLVLISGGGSALLPLPIVEMTLQQKTAVVRALARKGADIEELNIVRIAMSQIKGGKLAHAARGALKIFSLIISDIVNDPLHLIASGPTVEFSEDGRSAQSILQKYDLWSELDPKIKTALLKTNQVKSGCLRNNSVYLIGSNKIAANAALIYSRELGYKSCILSTTIVGSLDELTEKYHQLLTQLQSYLRHNIDENEFAASYPFGKESYQLLLTTIRSCQPGDIMCLILAGEPTALVSGDGMGGRNQELALRMSKIFYQDDRLRSISFLSAGTDGIDGPTDAAGAIGCAEVVEQFLKGHAPEEPEGFIQRNDSYNFYKKVGDGRFHILTGHTGTNVMDIHLFAVPMPSTGKL